MASEIKIELQGDKQLIQNLEKLGIALIDIVEPATVAGADIVHRQAEGDAPGDGIGVVQEVVGKTETSATVGIGADKDHFYLNIIESGRAAYSIKPNGAKALLIDGEFASKATIPAAAGRPWLRPALDENVQSIIDEIGEEFWEAVEQAIQ